MKGLVQFAVGMAALGAYVATADPMPRRAATPTHSVPNVLGVAEDVRVPVDGVVLAGTLTAPARPGPHPAVLLVSGAGPHDRDGEVSGQRPFRVIAERLTAAGFIVLRLDDRGVGESEGVDEQTTIAMRVSDGSAAVAWLAARPEVDRVGVIGHSEGATVAASVAAHQPLSFVVSLAGPGVSGRELGPHQVASVLNASGPYAAPTVTALVAAQRRIVDTIAADGDLGAITAAVHAGLITFNDLQPPTHRESPAALAVQAARDGELVASPWFRSYVQTDPRAAWRGVRCPVLALNGNRDVQVSATVNLVEIKNALADNPDVTTVVLPGLNHLLQRADTGLASEYGTIAHAIDEQALTLIVDFATQHTR